MPINYTYNYPEVARDAGFKLKQYKDGPMDWRFIGSLEIDRLLHDQSLEQIDGILQHLCEAPLGGMLETNILGTGIAKYFVLSQLSIQYLMFCRQFLDETIRDLRESHAASAIELSQTKKALADANNEILQLHRRLTQMEAIHEVVYPCHLCSKSFVNNDSLNIHINRKHAHQMHHSTPDRMGGGVAGAEMASGSPHSRDNDINLINTIKLELEIKKLKERLNVAERDIREKAVKVSPRNENHTPRNTKTIGIQSNLCEIKEKDSGDVNDSDLQERKEQLLALQEKIRDFEYWKESQLVHNAESIAEINRKLEDIALALENAKLTQEEAVEQQQNPLQRKVSPSVEDLERILMEKVAEIGKASAEKLEEVVYHMESSYKDKLNELEREIKKRNADRERRAALRKERGNCIETDSSITETDGQSVRQQHEQPIAEEFNDRTFNIANDSFKATAKQLKDKAFDMKKDKPKDTTEMSSTSLESNRTFVQENHKTAAELRPRVFVEPLHIPEDEHTDVSDTLSEESEHVPEMPFEDNNNDDDDDVAAEVRSLDTSDSEDSNNNNDDADEMRDKLTPLEKRKREKKPPTKPPRCYTRKDASRMADVRLRSFGLDIKMSELSAASAKRINSELIEKRVKLKQKYPHFFGTRNKIRKFVDKLCSNKLPESAEALLNAMEPLQPLHTLSSLNKRRTFFLSDDDDDGVADEVHEFEKLEMKQSSSTPLSFTRNADFKERLESLLATPLQQPPDHRHANEPEPEVTKPQPLPRKRVMFNTQTDFYLSEIDVNDADGFLDGPQGRQRHGAGDDSASEYSGRRQRDAN